MGTKYKLNMFNKIIDFPDKIIERGLISEEIDRKFIPPKCSHFEEIWEAGAKSFKFHLKRAIYFNYEEIKLFNLF